TRQCLERLAPGGTITQPLLLPPGFWDIVEVDAEAFHDEAVLNSVIGASLSPHTLHAVGWIAAVQGMLLSVFISNSRRPASLSDCSQITSWPQLSSQ
ncbi:MAG: hypothetical protein ABSE16_18010, partial [Verrucomicrobiota bacterium]